MFIAAGCKGSVIAAMPRGLFCEMIQAGGHITHTTIEIHLYHKLTLLIETASGE